MPITPPINGCILANEVLDNFPHHILEIRSARLQELHVGLEGDKLVLVPLEISSKAVARAGAHLSDGAPEGHRFEVSLETEPWIDSAAQSIQRGYILLIDYGYVTRELSRTSAGTLVGYSRQRLVDPLQNPGEVDITAHVDFTVVRARLEQAGLDVHEPVSQRELLGSLGMSSHLNRLLAEANAAYGAQSLRLHAERSAAQALVAKGGLGDLKVLIAARNAALPTLAGIKALP